MADLLDIPINADQNTNNNPLTSGSTQPINTTFQAAQTSPTANNLPSQNQTDTNANTATATTNSNNNPIDPIAIPIQDMQAKLSASGSLLTQVGVQNQTPDVDNSPLASLQPKNLVQTEQGAAMINQPSTVAQDQSAEILYPTTHVPTSTPVMPDWLKLLPKYLQRALVVILTLNGLYGTYQAVNFILVKYPNLEMQLLAHQISQTAVNQYAAEVVVVIFTTIINFLFALYLAKHRSAQILPIFFGVGLFLFSNILNNYLIYNFDLSGFISLPTTWLLNMLSPSVDIVNIP